MDVGPADWQHRPEPDVAAAPGGSRHPVRGDHFGWDCPKIESEDQLISPILIGRKAVAWDQKKRCYPADFDDFYPNSFVCNGLRHFGLFRMGESMFTLSPSWKICLAIS